MSLLRASLCNVRDPASSRDACRDRHRIDQGDDSVIGLTAAHYVTVSFDARTTDKNPELPCPVVFVRSPKETKHVACWLDEEMMPVFVNCDRCRGRRGARCRRRRLGADLIERRRRTFDRAALILQERSERIEEHGKRALDVGVVWALAGPSP